MTATITWSCDGHRHGQPCRGALHTSIAGPADAWGTARRAGWRSVATHVELCPSGGHDEDEIAVRS